MISQTLRQSFTRLRIPQTTLLRSTQSTTTTTTTRSNSTLIIAEPPPSSTTTTLSPATLSTITAAEKLHSGPITLLNLTSPPPPPSSLPPSVSRVIHADLPHGEILAEPASSIIEQAHSSGGEGGGGGYTHIVGPATKFGSHVIPRAAALLGSSCAITDVVSVEGEDTFIRPIYAGNALCRVQADSNNNTNQPILITIRATAFDKAQPAPAHTCETTFLPPSPSPSPPLTTHLSSNTTPTNRPTLTSAPIVISGGRGLQSRENFTLLLEPLASALSSSAAVGASRAAVDAGMAPNDWQVGQTGKVVAPDLYVAVGISGAIQHLSGMKESRVIVAINKDEDAPIFAVADYGLVGDLFEVVPELLERLGD